MLVAIFATYGFSRFNFPGKGIINTIIISVQAIPPVVLVIPYLSLVVSLKLYNTYGALILTYLVLTLPYAILMITGYFNTLPKDLDEAIMIDGGSRLRALWQVLVPISVPGLVSVGMYTFMQAWNEYLFALTLTQTNDKRTVPIGINLLMGQHSYEWNQMMAISVLGSLPGTCALPVFPEIFPGRYDSRSSQKLKHSVQKDVLYGWQIINWGFVLIKISFINFVIKKSYLGGKNKC